MAEEPLVSMVYRQPTTTEIDMNQINDEITKSTKLLVLMKELQNRWYVAPFIMNGKGSVEELNCISFKDAEQMDHEVALLATAFKSDFTLLGKVHSDGAIKLAVCDGSGKLLGVHNETEAEMASHLPMGSAARELLSGKIPEESITNEEAMRVLAETQPVCAECDDPDCPMAGIPRSAPPETEPEPRPMTYLADLYGSQGPKDITEEIAKHLGVPASQVLIMQISEGGKVQQIN